jgi:mono/diheme cytochrome c family protein
VIAVQRKWKRDISRQEQHQGEVLQISAILVRRELPVCLALAASLILAGCHAAPSFSPQQAAGKRLYQLRCAHCHEENDLALKKVPPDLHGVFDRKTLPSGAPATDWTVRQNILFGKGMMPSFNGRFSEEQMAALLAYLHTGLR